MHSPASCCCLLGIVVARSTTWSAHSPCCPWHFQMQTIPFSCICRWPSATCNCFACRRPASALGSTRLASARSAAPAWNSPYRLLRYEQACKNRCRPARQNRIENGRHYRLRPVTSIDLLASLSMEDPADAAAYVLTSCLEPAEGLLAATEHFDVLNQGAELRFQVVCPSCRSSETLDLDIAGFVWAEVRLGAQRLLGEIHELASAYGWSEESIAVMSEQRRAAYLEMLSA